MTASVFKNIEPIAPSVREAMEILVEDERRELVRLGADPEAMKRWQPGNRLQNILYRQHLAALKPSPKVRRNA